MRLLVRQNDLNGMATVYTARGAGNVEQSNINIFQPWQSIGLQENNCDLGNGGTNHIRIT